MLHVELFVERPPPHLFHPIWARNSFFTVRCTPKQNTGKCLYVFNLGSIGHGHHWYQPGRTGTIYVDGNQYWLHLCCDDWYGSHFIIEFFDYMPILCGAVYLFLGTFVWLKGCFWQSGSQGEELSHLLLWVFFWHHRCCVVRLKRCGTVQRNCVYVDVSIHILHHTTAI